MIDIFDITSLLSELADLISQFLAGIEKIPQYDGGDGHYWRS